MGSYHQICGADANGVIRKIKIRWAISNVEDTHMAERKPSITRAPKRPELAQLMQRDKERGVSEAVLEEQLASFAYGNAPKGSRITKASARSTSKSLRLIHA